MENEVKHVLPDYLSLTDYAKLTRRSRQSIYGAIEDGRLKPTYVGKDRIPLVSPDTEVDFRELNKNKSQ